MMVLFVYFEMFGQVLDAGTEQCDLYLRRTRIIFVLFERFDDVFFSLFV